jgi:hypothetical protein
MTKFLLRCVDQEANGLTPSTFRAFCEDARAANIININSDACILLNSKLASIAGETGAELIDPSKVPNLCIKFQNGIIHLYRM